VLDSIEEEAGQGGCIIDFHSCEMFPESWIDLVVVLQTDHTVLWGRLEGRYVCCDEVNVGDIRWLKSRRTIKRKLCKLYSRRHGNRIRRTSSLFSQAITSIKRKPTRNELSNGYKVGWKRGYDGVNRNDTWISKCRRPLLKVSAFGLATGYLDLLLQVESLCWKRLVDDANARDLDVYISLVAREIVDHSAFRPRLRLSG
jgi:hypothetical protein